MARPKRRLPGEDLVVRKLVLSGVGDKCVGTDETGNQYHTTVFLGPSAAAEMDATLKELGEERFRRVENFMAMRLCKEARFDPALLDARPNYITR